MTQTLTSIHLHVIFSTKNREKLIDPVIEPELYAFLVSNISKKGTYVHKIGGVEDHIHMLITLNKTSAVSDLMEDVKKNSSRWIKTKGQNYQSFSWQKGYGAFSISPSHKAPIIRYIAAQKEHHKKVSFQDEFRKILKKNETLFDERYVWE
jgi:REP element-mobilizing transposase RayT